MSYEYDHYLIEHRGNVRKAFKWLKENLPETVVVDDDTDIEYQICFAHDESKDNPDEYAAYDAYFYGGNRSYATVKEFEKAFLYHLHRNPHHWQYWILVAYDDEKGQQIFEMPYKYIVEMICDWWSFSWKTGNLEEIFNWYEDHKDHIQLASKTRETVERILEEMKTKLSERDQ